MPVAPTRQAARKHDVVIFARFLGQAPAVACAELVAHSRGQANALALAFRQHEQQRCAAAASINRRLATLRRIVALANRLELVEWSLTVDDLTVTSHRDTRGPGDDGWRKLWAAAVARGDTPKARRDRVLLRLLHTNALRRSEAIALDDPTTLTLTACASRSRGRVKETTSRGVTIPTLSSVTGARVARLAAAEVPGPLFTSHPRVDAEHHFELVERVNKLRAAGRSCDVAELLNDEGLRTPTGRRVVAPTTGERGGSGDEGREADGRPGRQFHSRGDV